MAKSLPPARERPYRAQVAALPIRKGKGGAPEVMLITSRETRRWIVPKGWPIKGLKDHQAAAQEALEEAGIAGRVRKHPVGAYTYQKRLNDHVQSCRVMVYLLKVDKQLKTWGEKDERMRQWFPAREAAQHVSEPGLASMILRLTDAHAAYEGEDHEGNSPNPGR